MTAKRLPGLTIFFPALNDGKIIPYLVCRAHEVAALVADRYEIVVINDGSTDETAEVLGMLQKHYPELKVIDHPVNLGYGMAIRDGFKVATMPFVFYTDGDGQYDPMELTRLVARMGRGIDVVNGKQVQRSDNWLRKLTGEAYNLFLHWLYPLPIEDVDCDFRLCRRSILRKIKLTSTSGAICLEMIYKLALVQARFTEVEVNHYPRPYGFSEYFKMKNIIRTLLQQWRLYRELGTNYPRSN